MTKDFDRQAHKQSSWTRTLHQNLQPATPLWRPYQISSTWVGGCWQMTAMRWKFPRTWRKPTSNGASYAASWLGSMMMGLFYKAMVQAVLLYGTETWNLMQPLWSLLWSFHHQCAHYLAQMTITQLDNGTWVPHHLQWQGSRQDLQLLRSTFSKG